MFWFGGMSVFPSCMDPSSFPRHLYIINTSVCVFSHTLLNVGWVLFNYPDTYDFQDLLISMFGKLTLMLKTLALAGCTDIHFAHSLIDILISVIRVDIWYDRYWNCNAGTFIGFSLLVEMMVLN
jgi:hypothetical protein